jgi:hypothetical protein
MLMLKLSCIAVIIERGAKGKRHQQGALAGAILSDQADNFAAIDLEVGVKHDVASPGTQ